MLQRVAMQLASRSSRPALLCMAPRGSFQTGAISSLHATRHSAMSCLSVGSRHFSTQPTAVDMQELSMEEFRSEHEITLNGRTEDLDTTPIFDFDKLERIDEDNNVHTLPKGVLKYFDKKGFQQPSPIQAQSLPISLAGRDLIGVAQTGSGKTLGFLIPLFWQVVAARAAADKASSKMGPLAIVLAPTRELAQQIEAEARTIGGAFGCTTLCVFGGQPRFHQERQIHRLRRRLDLVVATPGRLVDFVRSNVLPLHAVNFLVLDEADRMLDMGFEPQLREIADEVAPSAEGRQTLMFSATWPKEVCGDL
jgi:ATP-dependent RNA helicase DDX5/DBP2